MKSAQRFCWLGAWLFASCSVASPGPGRDEDIVAERFDVVIYGATSAGVAAAVQVRRMGKSVVILERSDHVGGLTTGGLGATDIGNKAAIGGIAREFYRAIFRHYASDDAWREQRRENYYNYARSPGEDTMWTFEPHVASRVYREWIARAGIEIRLRSPLDREDGVEMRAGNIVSIATQGGRRFRGRVFIDATYEGDLLAAAGVSYFVGREGNSTYDETLNGVQTQNAVHHQMQPGVDPYVVPGDPASGLLPGIDPEGPGEEGATDPHVQAYNFRLCVTDAPTNRVPFEKPAGYDPLEYELLFRNFAAGERRVPWSNLPMPNRKTDINNNFGVSTDFIGRSDPYPEASDDERERLFSEHLEYTQGLLWTLANHPRVPAHVRKEIGRWGLTKDEFTETGGWPPQLYVREARRMIGELVMTQHHCQGRERVDDVIGLAAYTMDSHNVQRYVRNGEVRNEGDVQVGGFSPYGISYRALCPKRKECENLLVPVCLSASHIAYGSIRMEPVFMVLGQSAGTAACLAIDGGTSVQAIPMDKLQARLQADGQALEWAPRG